VGGYLVNWANDGYLAADMAVRVLNGEKPENIPIVRSNDAYMFDARALKAVGTQGKCFASRPALCSIASQAFGSSTSDMSLLAFSLFLAQALIIAALLWQRARRRANRSRVSPL